jgi:hypothetical protein
MKALQLVLSLLVIAALPLRSASAGPEEPNQEAPKQVQKLAIKPKDLSLIEVQGAKLYVSSSLRLFIVDNPLVGNPNVDSQALYNKAKQCVAGQGCGRVLTSLERSAVYGMVEASNWSEGTLVGRLVGLSVSSSTTMVFTDARASLTDATSQLFVAGRLCQCPPPGGIPPRDEWLLNVVLRGWPQS